MADRSTPVRQEHPSTPLNLVTVPVQAIDDDRLSWTARGLYLGALAAGGELDVAVVARAAVHHPTESVDDLLDAVGQLLHHGYVTLTGDTMTITGQVGA